MEEHVEGHDDQVEVEPKPEQLDEYPGGPHDLSMLTMYHVHVARRMMKWQDSTPDEQLACGPYKLAWMGNKLFSTE